MDGGPADGNRERMRRHWRIAYGGTKHEAGTALLARKSQVRYQSLWFIIRCFSAASLFFPTSCSTNSPLACM
ncbi:hypothetical protein BDA96_04G266100 [Sorghum bicolor]|uniref:Uncharacterized protein n=2 Tax=Sorghum bicolor TaxID=4558 RepID=A0A921R810_SORBI|nr:hypothetical protein SORBI_3004G249900 [Sorghum bicolor]KAG0534276.1 hypothetical protein BDA96_04G266100 [Sorghum bicolor]